jgi:putative flippase GtrA
MDSPTVNKKQPVIARLMFFVLGGGMSSLLNTGIFRLCNKALHWPEAVALAISVVTTAVIFFLWSYYVNFRTARVWKDCLPRYLGCLLICNALNYVIGLSGIKKFGTGFLMTYAVVVVVYSLTGCVKFLLYNYWVFPTGTGAGEPSPAS